MGFMKFYEVFKNEIYIAVAPFDSILSEKTFLNDMLSVARFLCERW